MNKHVHYIYTLPLYIRLIYTNYMYNLKKSGLGSSFNNLLTNFSVIVTGNVIRFE